MVRPHALSDFAHVCTQCLKPIQALPSDVRPLRVFDEVRKALTVTTLLDMSFDLLLCRIPPVVPTGCRRRHVLGLGHPLRVHSEGMLRAERTILLLNDLEAFFPDQPHGGCFYHQSNNSGKHIGQDDSSLQDNNRPFESTVVPGETTYFR